jgi:hypothetical protein
VDFQHEASLKFRVILEIRLKDAYINRHKMFSTAFIYALFAINIKQINE